MHKERGRPPKEDSLEHEIKIRVSDEMLQQIDKHAAQQNLTRSMMIRSALAATFGLLELAEKQREKRAQEETQKKKQEKIAG